MEADPVLLSRVQFALTVGFHYLFPPITIGLGVLLVIFEGTFLATGNRQYEALARFWTRIFALTFALGVASGIVMEFQFGTNWATYSRFVGDIFGSALAAEAIFAFFLESGFLALMVFGWDRVSRRTHFVATVLVSVGSILSAVWIIVANSWQHTPAGYHLVTRDGLQVAEITDFWAVVFNPSTVHRLVHTLIGAFIMGGFLVISVSACYLLRGRHEEPARKSLRIALPFTFVFSLAALFSGHGQAVNVARTQPAKLAAFEGHFRTLAGGAPLYLFGIADEQQRRVRFGLGIPGGLSFLLHGDFVAPVTALDDPAIVPGGLPPGEEISDYWPPVNLSFQLYHLMVGLGMLFIALSFVGLLAHWRGSLPRQRWLLRILVVAVVGPVLANQAGWAAAEVGRQPWIVYGLLKTADAASKAVSAGEVLTSLIIFGLIYLVLLVLWLVVLAAKIREGPPELPEPTAAAREEV